MCDIAVDYLMGFFQCNNWFGQDTRSKWNCNVCSKKTLVSLLWGSLLPWPWWTINILLLCGLCVGNREPMTSCLAQLWNWGICLPCFGAVSALTFGILPSAFPSQLILLAMSMEVHFRWIHWVVLSAHIALILMDLMWAVCCCLRGQKPTCMLISQDCV